MSLRHPPLNGYLNRDEIANIAIVAVGVFISSGTASALLNNGPWWVSVLLSILIATHQTLSKLNSGDTLVINTPPVNTPGP